MKFGCARAVSLMDSEGDIFDLFAARDQGGLDLVVRA